jgi:hypothetical protein
MITIPLDTGLWGNPKRLATSAMPQSKARVYLPPGQSSLPIHCTLAIWVRRTPGSIDRKTSNGAASAILRRQNFFP